MPRYWKQYKNHKSKISVMKTPHISPSQTSYGMPFKSSLEKNNCEISRVHWVWGLYIWYVMYETELIFSGFQIYIPVIITTLMPSVWPNDHVEGLVQERHNSIANTLELHLSCTNPWMLFPSAHHCWLCDGSVLMPYSITPAQQTVTSNAMATTLQSYHVGMVTTLQFVDVYLGTCRLSCVSVIPLVLPGAPFTMTMTMKIILLPCNTCGIHSYSRTLTCYIQQSVMEIWKE